MTVTWTPTMVESAGTSCGYAEHIRYSVPGTPGGMAADATKGSPAFCAPAGSSHGTFPSGFVGLLTQRPEIVPYPSGAAVANGAMFAARVVLRMVMTTSPKVKAR
jgi:hypothetical protein